MTTQMDRILAFVDGVRDEIASQCPQCRKYILNRGYDHEEHGCGSGGEFDSKSELEHRAEALGVPIDRSGWDDPKADCGCVHHAEQGVPCEHDLALLIMHAEEDRESMCREQAEFCEDLTADGYYP